MNGLPEVHVETGPGGRHHKGGRIVKWKYQERKVKHVGWEWEMGDKGTAEGLAKWKPTIFQPKKKIN